MTDGIDEIAADALQVQIDEAQQSGDTVKANELYREQMGVVPEPTGLEDAEPDVEGEEPAGPDAEVDAEAPANDDAVVPTPGFEELAERWQAEYQSWGDLTEFEQNDEYEKIYAAADPGMAARILKVAWPGSDYAKNVEFAKAMMVTVPGSLEVLRVLEATGMGDHPAILKWLAAAGRLMAATPGDPTSIPSSISQPVKKGPSGKVRKDFRSILARAGAIVIPPCGLWFD